MMADSLRRLSDAFPRNRLLTASVCLLLLVSWDSTAGAQKTTAPPVAANHQLQIKDAVFHSASLQRDMRYRVILPRAYADGGRFPVLYLLHGLYGDYLNWDTRTHLEGYARLLPLIIVMPDADDSWYTNSATVPEDKFEDYIAKDLISEIDHHYRTVQDRHARAIAGLSMGGYGAIKFGIKYPELYAFAGSLSGALDAAQNLDTLRPEFRAKLLEVFGPDDDPQRKENDVFQLLNTAPPASSPYFYLACGTNDFFVDANRAFVLQLSSRKVAYEYHETPGGHTWEYWDGSVEPMLRSIEQILRIPPARTLKTIKPTSVQ